MANEAPVAMRSLSEVRKQGLTESELREGLRAYLRSSGHVSSLTAQLRHRVLTEFGVVHTAHSIGREEAPGRAMRTRMRWSLIAEAMRCCGLHHSVSVFVAECGLGRLESALSREETASLLGLENEARATVNCLLDLMLESQTREMASEATQTQEEFDSPKSPTSLGEQLRRIREEYDAKRAKRATRPASMEDWAHECESRYARRLEAEVRRIKETEVRVAKRELESNHRKQLEAVSAAARAEAAERKRIFQEREAWVESKAAAEVRVAEEAAANERRELARQLTEVTEREMAQKRAIDHERRALEMYEARLEQQEAAIVWRIAAARADEKKCSRLEAELANAVATVASLRAAATDLATADDESPLGSHELLTERGPLASSNFAIDSSSDYGEVELPLPAKHRRARSTPRKRRPDFSDDKAHTQPLERQIEAMRAEHTALCEESAGLRGLVAQSRAALEAVASLPASAFSRPDIASSDPNGVLRAAFDALGIRKGLMSSSDPRPPPAVQDDYLPLRQDHREACGGGDIERRRWELLNRLDRDKCDMEDRWRKGSERRAATQENLLHRVMDQRRPHLVEFLQQQGPPFPEADVQPDAAPRADICQSYPKAQHHSDDTQQSNVAQKPAYDDTVYAQRSPMPAESCDTARQQPRIGTLQGPTQAPQPMHTERPHETLPGLGSSPTLAAIKEQEPPSLVAQAEPDEPRLQLQAQEDIIRRPPHMQSSRAQALSAPQQAPRAAPEAPVPASTEEVVSIAAVEHAELAESALQFPAQENNIPRSHADSPLPPSQGAPATKPASPVPDRKLVQAATVEPAPRALVELAASTAPKPAPSAPSVKLVPAATMEPGPSSLAKLAAPTAPQVQATENSVRQRDKQSAEEAVKEDIHADDFCVDVEAHIEKSTSAIEEVKGVVHIVDLPLEAEEITSNGGVAIAGGAFEERESEGLDRDSKNMNREEATAPGFTKQHHNQMGKSQAKFDASQLCKFKEVFEASCDQDEQMNIMSLCGALDKLSGTRPRRAEVEKLLDSFCKEGESVDRNSNQIKGFDQFVAFLNSLDETLYRPPPEVDAVALFEQKLEETKLRRAREAARRAVHQPSMAVAPSSDRKRESDGENFDDSASSISVGASHAFLQQIISSSQEMVQLEVTL